MTLAAFLSTFRWFPQTLLLRLGPMRSEDRPHQPKIKARAPASTSVFSMSFPTKSSAPLRTFFQSLPAAAEAVLNTEAVLFVLRTLLQVQFQLSFVSPNSIPAHSTSVPPAQLVPPSTSCVLPFPLPACPCWLPTTSARLPAEDLGFLDSSGPCFKPPLQCMLRPTVPAQLLPCSHHHSLG